jgi:hypothetical protein
LRLCPPYNSGMVICPTGWINCAIRARASLETASASRQNTCAEKLISPARSSRFGHPPLRAQKFLFTKIRNRGYLTPSRLDRRGVRVVTDVAAGGSGRGRHHRTSDADADGEIVWSWHPDAGVKFAKLTTRGRRWLKSPVHRGEHEYRPLKPLRREGRLFRSSLW